MTAIATPARAGSPSPPSPPSALHAALEEVERRLVAVASPDDAFAGEVCRHYVTAGGKRLRPTLLLLAASCFGDPSDGVLDAAVAVEALHTATLFYDDVIDEATTRRWRPSANARWGNRSAVQAGNLLFFRAMEAFAGFGHPVLGWVSDAVDRLWAGEEQEAQRMHDRHRDCVDYFEVIEAKTATLCALPCVLGAHLAGAAPAAQDALERFGRHLGIAFQIIDDVLDVVGDDAGIGKAAGSDLRDGVYTLPVIDALEDPAVGPALHALLKPDLAPERVAGVVALVRASGALHRAVAVALNHVDSAIAALDALPSGDARDALAALASAVMQRDELGRRL